MKLYTEIIALCDYALIAQDNKLSIIGIFDEFRVSKFPNGFTEKFLVATINGKPNTSYKLAVKLEKEGNNSNLLNPVLITAQTSSNGKHNLLVRLANVGFEEEGLYRFVIYNGDDEVGFTFIRVIYLSKEQKQEIHKMPN